MKEFTDHNFEFEENGKKLSKQVENTVGKGEIARYEQFLLSHSVFKRLVSQGRQKVSLCGNGLNCNFFGLTLRLKMSLTHYQTTKFWMCQNSKHVRMTN